MWSIAGRVSGVALICLLFLTGMASRSFGPEGREALRLAHLVPRHAVSYPGGRTLLLGRPGPAGTSVARLTSSGARDRSFGEGGIVRLGFSVADIAVQADGRIVAAGSEPRSGSPGARAMLVARLLPDGRLDASFGEAGTETIELGQPREEARAVAIGGAGKIVIGGTSGLTFSRPSISEAVVVRLETDGSPNLAFGEGGSARLGSDQAFFSTVTDLEVLPCGKIIAAVPREDQILEITWIDSDGTLEHRFGGSGSFAVEPPGVGGQTGASFEPLDQIGVLSDGRVVVVGTRREPPHGRASIVALRYLWNGRLDPNFGAGGIVTPRGHNSAAAFALQRGGRLAIASGQDAAKGLFSVFCWDRRGRLDPRFGHGGRTRVAFGMPGWASKAGAVAFQPSGAVTIAGTATLLAPSSPFPMRTGFARQRLRPPVR
jgi:uncharacterized delta-60 repeat protein